MSKLKCNLCGEMSMLLKIYAPSASEENLNVVSAFSTSSILLTPFFVFLKAYPKSSQILTRNPKPGGRATATWTIPRLAPKKDTAFLS